MARETSNLEISVFDGTRNPFPSGIEIQYRVIDGRDKEQVYSATKLSTLDASDLPFYDNDDDAYRCVVSSDGYRQAGFVPIMLTPLHDTILDLMLIPSAARFDFSQAPWDAIKTRFPFLAAGVDDASGQTRYEDLRTGSRPGTLAGLFNITTVMEHVFLPQGTPLSYLKLVKWDGLNQDRFFAYCDPALIDQVKIAAAHGEFAKEYGSALFHPGATSSWKQVQFGEANLQLTFHEQDRELIDGVSCILVEPDIDYFKDPLAHLVLEVVHNKLTGGLTNPEEVYVLRWIAGRHDGVPEFDPPYTIVA